MELRRCTHCSFFPGYCFPAFLSCLPSVVHTVFKMQRTHNLHLLLGYILSSLPKSPVCCPLFHTLPIYFLIKLHQRQQPPAALPKGKTPENTWRCFREVGWAHHGTLKARYSCVCHKQPHFWCGSDPGDQTLHGFGAPAKHQEALPAIWGCC